MLQIKTGQLDHPQVKNLLATHLQKMHAQTPAESVHALSFLELKSPDITFYSAWHQQRLAGVVALKRLSSQHCEIKSMRTASAFLRQGVASDLLSYVVADAASLGYATISLETGRGEDFKAAHYLYEQFGFVDCEPFANYQHDPLSRYMHRHLVARRVCNF